jgi:hypothetical protein
MPRTVPRQGLRQDLERWTFEHSNASPYAKGNPILQCWMIEREREHDCDSTPVNVRGSVLDVLIAMKTRESWRARKTWI